MKRRMTKKKIKVCKENKIFPLKVNENIQCVPADSGHRPSVGVCDMSLFFVNCHDFKLYVSGRGK